MFSCDLLLKSLDLIGPEFHDIARLDVNQMVVMFLCGALEAGAPVAEDVFLQHALFPEKVERSIDGGDCDAWIDCSHPPVQFNGIRMIVGVRQYVQNDPAWPGKP